MNNKKIFINDLETDERNRLIKNNKKLVDILCDDLYQSQMWQQEEEGRLLLGKDSHKYIEMKDNYSSFYLILKNWSEFIENLDIEYLWIDSAIALYNEIIKKRDLLYNMDADDENYYTLEEEIYIKCKELLKHCETQLHTYEELPTIDDVIQYADEMEQLNDYYIEEREDGTSDGVIRKDIAFTECYIWVTRWTIFIYTKK